ncbi:hypothetical protein GGI18_001632, partial [Coemansia linderi]
MGDSKPPESNETGSLKPAPRHPPVVLSYYNSRLAPIQKKEVLPTSYHGVYQGVPLVDEVIPVTWKPWESDSAAANDTGSSSRAKVVVDQPPLEPAPVATPSDKAPDTASGTAKKSQQEPKPTRKKASAARAQSSASSRSRKRNSIAPSTQPTRRPLTSLQDAHAKHYTEWRDIHVQSLSRVDSILREAVGLRASGPSRWSACASPLQGSEEPVAPPHSGLGITVSQSKSLPPSREASSRPQTAAAANQGMYSLFASNASTSAFGGQGDPARALPRPNTSSSYLSTSVSRPSLLGNSRRSGESAVSGTDDASTARPVRAHTASSLDRPHSEARGESMYLPNQVPRPATTHAPPQQTSLVDKRKPIYAARPRPATVFGLSGPTLREARNNQATSLYSSGDILSRKQTAKRWSRTLIQNQHLFRAQTIADQLDLESTFGDGDDVDEAASSHEASSPPQPLQLDLPPDVDLYQDVTQALAERLPLSARSTTSTLSAATMAMRGEHAVSVAFPLTGSQFLSLQADAAFGMPTFTDKNSFRRPTNSKGTASDESATATAKSSPHVPAAEKSKKRESIYINSEDLFDSALLAEAELPYQQEHGALAGTTQVPSAEEYTPTIAASSLPGSEKLHINFDAEAVTELDIDTLTTRDFIDESEFTASASALDDGPDGFGLPAPLSAPVTSLRTERPSTVFGDSRPSATKSSTAECLSDTARPKLGTRHSEIVRQQLRYVEGHTPATKLGSELSKSDDEHRQMLDAYMKRFDFCDQPIDFALRQLFQELHLPAESQQIDRVITSFAGRYHSCNPELFFSADIVYAYAFAILLLHTDAHNPKVKHKISKAQFVARAKLLDEHEPGRDNEMFDEILDILYDNITMVKFEYAPSSMLGGQPFATAPATQRPATSQGIGTHQYHTSGSVADLARDQSPGISGWLRRVFAPTSSATMHNKSPLSPQDVPSKEQYSYSSLPRRRFAPVGLGPASPTVAVSDSQLPPTPTISRPSTSHGTISRSSNYEGSLRGGERDSFANYEYDDNLLASSMSSMRLRASTVAPSVNIPQISPLGSDFAMTYSSPILGEAGCEGEGGDILLGRISSSAFYTPPSEGGLAAAATQTQDTQRPSTARPYRSSPLAVDVGSSQRRLAHISSSPESDVSSPGALSPPSSPRGPQLGLSLSTSFATSDVAVSAQPLVVETIRLSGVKSHVKRRISLRQGRPLSGIIYQKPSPSLQRQQHEQHHNAVIGCAGVAGSSISAAVVAAATASASSALLRVDMSGRVSRKMELLDNGRRGLVRRWKDNWMVLSGSRLYFFRSNDAAQSEAQQHQQPAHSNGGPDSGSLASSGGGGRPAMSIQTIVPLREGVAIVDAAYKKYPHVFRILAGDGSQVLIKAANDDAVAEWMARINCAAAFKTMGVER